MAKSKVRWSNPQTCGHQASIEELLASGRLFVAMGGGRFWQARRNGKTQTWKKRPGDYRLPIKAGLASTGEITQDTDPKTLRIADSQDEANISA